MDLHASLPLHKGYYKYKSGHIYYEIKGKGAPLLLIPGGSGDCWWLHKIADALSGNFQVISYDLYGKARSITHTPSNIDINQFAKDAINLVTALGLEKVYIVGVSSGAVIALDIAEKYPAYVKEMIVFEPPLICIHPRFDALSKHFAKVYLTALKWGESIAGLRFALGTGLPIAPILRSGSAYKDHLKIVPIPV
ncbi:alpha/beta hydrolase [Arachidicoccus ginsenosidivorans]|uniref:Alpha/beta hydrolase n=1 Tax=Arachidicoccus ginsenosidivorans TaxID=496057 RepID=A0A5B8VKJ3_9BACT|nr:alpha/beta hydrolase [Arachidicoccus ginsenosidivorans]QEC71475.1 alpha/beta hydrolase [Arachidicoccus ginsenosidivorans]